MVCDGCGEWRTDQVVVADELVCTCGFRRPFKTLPLFVVTGTSGAGKSTLAQRMAGTTDALIVLDGDTLWSDVVNTPEDGYATFFGTWHRVISNLNQSGRPTLWFGGGKPHRFPGFDGMNTLGTQHWLALVCDDEILVERLKARPAWRFNDGKSIESFVAHNAHLRNRSDVDHVDTTHLSIDDTVAAIRAWLTTKGVRL